MRDYVALMKKRKPEAKQHGIKGMRWGIRRTDKQIAKDTMARKASGEKVTNTAKAQQAATVAKTDTTPAAPESASQKYARMTAEAKGGGAKGWSEQDLKFFNARTEALSKVNKMFAQKPGWVKETSTKVLRQAAQTAMQNVADGVAKKYISGPLIESLNDNSKAIAAESKTPVDYVGRHRAKKK